MWVAKDLNAPETFVSHVPLPAGFSGVAFEENFLILSDCPALEQLEIENCDLTVVNKISSESLKRLSLTNCAFSESFRTRIHAPSLVSLLLDDIWSKTPVLESMPSLVDASIRIGENNVDSCDNCDSGDCSSCHGIRSVLQNPIPVPGTENGQRSDRASENGDGLLAPHALAPPDLPSKPRQK